MWWQVDLGCNVSVGTVSVLPGPGVTGWNVEMGIDEEAMFKVGHGSCVEEISSDRAVSKDYRRTARFVRVVITDADPSLTCTETNTGETSLAEVSIRQIRRGDP